MNNEEIYVIFYHIFKCGGTTFNWILQENFPDQVIYAESPLSTKKYLRREILKHNLEKLKNENTKICAISSHNICYSCHDLAKIAFSIIRKPNARNWSAYNFQKENGNLSYEEFLSKNSNFQVKVLTKGQKYKTEEIVHEIFYNFQLGILERFDESMVLFEWLFEKIGICLDFSYSNNFNSQNYDKKNITDSFDHYEVDQKMKEFFKLDNLLYDKANRKLDEELKKLPNLEKRLSDFKMRCEKLKEINYLGKRKSYGQGPQSFFYMQ